MEEFASVRGVAPAQECEGSIEQVARTLRGVSSDAEADIEVLLGGAAFAWLIADGDFHLKNMAVLRVAPDGAQNFSSVRIGEGFDDGVGTHVLRDLLGHKTTAMADRYIRTVGNPVRDAREQVSAVVAATMTGTTGDVIPMKRRGG